MGSRSSTDSGHNSTRLQWSERPLLVEIEIQFATTHAECPLIELQTSDVVTNHQTDGRTCRLEYCNGGQQTGVRQSQSPVTGTCLCPVFLDHGCLPRHAELIPYGIIYQANVSDRETLKNLISDLRGRADNVNLRRLLASDDGKSEGARCLIDLTVLTDVEHETLERAVIAGYYDQPQTTSFSALVEEFDITKSALSRRLTSAESKILGELFSKSE